MLEHLPNKLLQAANSQSQQPLTRKLNNQMDPVPSHSSRSSQQHVVLFPFMSKGHTIPLLQFARILLRREMAVTVFTTPANRPFVAQSLDGTATSIVTLPFPKNTTAAAQIAAGIESTDQLPSMSLFYEFASATASIQPHFDQALEALPRVSFMVTDGFLWWTLQSATKFNIPRFVYLGMSCYSTCLMKEATMEGIFRDTQRDDELVVLTQFPWIRLCKEDIDPSSINLEPGSFAYEFHMKWISAKVNSYGILVNTFYELEPTFVDYVNSKYSPKSWCVGPLCLAEQPLKVYDPEPAVKMKSTWVQWLDQKGKDECSVLYVAFGSQAEVSSEQLEEIAKGLEESMVSFLWVIRKEDWGLQEGFEERVKGRGIVVREWVDQREILMNESVGGFMSHCGWNSVLESICAGVPMVAWPMMAEQHLNAKMVEEELKVGLRVETCGGSVRGFVKWEGLRKTVRELMEGERGAEARKKVSEWARMAKMAVQEGGSSWCTFDSLLHEIYRKKETSRV